MVDIKPAEMNSAKKYNSFYFSYRFLLGIIGFFGYMGTYMQKINMGIGIVCMVNDTALSKLKSTSSNGSGTLFFNITESHENSTKNTCLFKEFKKNHFDGTFLWSKQTQGFILSSYYYGYVCFQILAGILATKFGSKTMLFIGMFFSSLLTMLIPVLARWRYEALIVCRFLIGISHAFFMPGMSALWAYWAPPNERSRLVGMSHAGGYIGNIVTLCIGGFLCVSGFDGGWPSIFYLIGIFGLIWVGLMLITFSSSPSNHRFISIEEKNFIIDQTKNISHTEKLVIPWRGILTSKACYAIFVSHFCHNWGLYLLMTQLPTYIKEVLKFDIKSNGLMSSLPFFSCWVFIIISSLLGDKIISSGKMSRKYVRKLFNGIGLAFPVVAIIALSFIDCTQPYIGVLLLSIGVAFMGFSSGAGYYVNINDIGGKYSSVIYGISNTFGTIPGLISPYIASALTPHRSQKEWQKVFIITSVIYLIGFFVYTLFADGETQTWAIDKNKNIEEKNETINQADPNEKIPNESTTF